MADLPLLSPSFLAQSHFHSHFVHEVACIVSLNNSYQNADQYNISTLHLLLHITLASGTASWFVHFASHASSTSTLTVDRDSLLVSWLFYHFQ